MAKTQTNYGELDLEEVARGRARVVWPRDSAKAVPAPTPRGPGPHYRSQLERDYATHLNCLMFVGEIKSHRFEAMRFLLAKRTSYCPDFLVVTRDGRIEFHEVKGAHAWEDSIVKLKVVAAMFPMFRFVLVTRPDGAWLWKEVPQ